MATLLEKNASGSTSKQLAFLSKRLGDRKGQALVELALVLFFWAMLSMGVVDFGRALIRIHQLTHAAREGVRSASSTVDIGSAASQTLIRDQIGKVLTDMGIVIPASDITINPVDLGTDGISDVVDITISQSYSSAFGTSLFPILNSLTIEAKVSMPVFAAQ